MPVINTNILSLATQNNLVRSKNGVSTAIERLASGLRINSAKDDSAGAGIANRFTANIRGYTQAGRNTSDGISLAQTTEGALSAVNDNVQRIRELSVQAANGSNGQSDLDSIQAEIRQRLDEIDRISAQTSFNGKHVLNKEEGLILQTGVNDNELVSLNTRVMNTEKLGIHYLNVNGLESVRLINQTEADSLTSGSGIPAQSLRVLPEFSSVALQNFTQQSGLSSDAISTDGRLHTGSDGKFYLKLDVTEPVVSPNDERFKTLRLPTNTDPVTSFFVEVNSSNYIGGGRFTLDDFKAENLRMGHLGAEGQNYGPNGGGNILSAGQIKTSERGEIPLSTIQAQFPGVDFTGISDPPTIYLDVDYWYYTDPKPDLDGISSNVLQEIDPRYDGLIYANGRFFITITGGPGAADLNFTQGQTVYMDVTNYLQSSQFTNGPDVFLNDGVSKMLTLDLQPLAGKVNSSELYLSSADPMLTQPQLGASAKTVNLLSTLDGSLAQIDDYRGELGAVMNRLESSLETISNTKINLEAARSRIRDADYALETSSLTRNQILQQAGTSVLTQANQIPQMVLQLLR